MKWTKELPTKDGTYWYRVDFGDPGDIITLSLGKFWEVGCGESLSAKEFIDGFICVEFLGPITPEMMEDKE